MDRKARIFVADDHPVVRDGLIGAINSQNDMVVCGEGGSAEEIFTGVERTSPDLLFMDLMLGRQDGLDLIKNLLGPYSDLKIVVVSMQEESLYSRRCLEAGARGFISKLLPTAEMIDALRSVLRGKKHFDLEMLLNAQSPSGDLLTDRELHILQMIGQGLKPSEIAVQLNISPRTVDTHRENLKRKLGATTSAQLLRIAIDLNSPSKSR
jgi:DNA-binding NarL/FixJ family response regulator